jgi:hypothetical protein
MDRASNGHKKAKRGRELATERVEENFGIVSKMQASERLDHTSSWV